jgi:hypothetical protein
MCNLWKTECGEIAQDGRRAVQPCGKPFPVWTNRRSGRPPSTPCVRDPSFPGAERRPEGRSRVGAESPVRTAER